MNQYLNKLPYFTSLMRVPQWIKNLFVFLPMFFNKQFVSYDSLLQASIAFISFSLIASAIYCFNDIVDIEFDKKHIKKKNRPIASGLISKREAQICMFICIVLGFLTSYFFNGLGLFWVILSYFIINILYSLMFKQIVVVDVVFIAVSFVLRLIAGSVATNTRLSHWIIIMVVLLALFLAFAKRRDELIIYLEEKVLVRKNIDKYSLKLLDATLKILALLIIILYLMYSFSEEIKMQFNSEYIWLTSIFVALGLFRYGRLIQLRHNYVNPTKILLRDFPLQLIVIGWITSFYIIIYT
ncbi:UbiA prenyltransferase family protein [Winogradskyella echinorum]|uniref:UbiA prenyltransferase family protein n=1 Tax=Winogradskyella echinorum TaxID=538189 RepID=A0ABR6XWG1_9FLAO|nr:UbiA prenyltransferase family protein [Winogradskyella echinorum]MBC3844828.1 UbiA prenyltransferase family protein [Winogradskyella echinorum]MBC5749176.1 UbiA prenyltransferase family protein [Winogradskyella echinorum]